MTSTKAVEKTAPGSEGGLSKNIAGPGLTDLECTRKSDSGAAEDLKIRLCRIKARPWHKDSSKSEAWEADSGHNFEMSPSFRLLAR